MEVLNLFKQQFQTLETAELINMFVSLSSTISALRDKPFCTIRQMETIENELNVNRITFQSIYEELLTRQLSESEQEQFAKAVQEC